MWILRSLHIDAERNGRHFVVDSLKVFFFFRRWHWNVEFELTKHIFNLTLSHELSAYIVSALAEMSQLFIAYGYLGYGMRWMWYVI